MVWIYNSPLTEKERKAEHVLKERFSDSDLAKHTVKIVSLIGVVKSKKFQSPKELENYFFYDKDQKEPIFNKTTSERLFKELNKQTGGAVSNYPFLDYSVKQSLEKIRCIIPDYILYPVENFYSLLSTPLLSLKQNVPLADVAISAANGMAETGINAVGDIAKTFGGPVGSIISIPLVALAASVAATSSLLQRDLGQSVIYIVSALPFIGSIMVKGLDKINKQALKIGSYPTIAYYIPGMYEFINEQRKEKGLAPLEPPQPFDPSKMIQDGIQSNSYVQKAKSLAPVSSFPAVGGKRFSTRKHTINNKWRKTRRNKSAKI